ncbi:hypothetical protein OKW49_002794 [Paraburkholderia youngii]
MRSESLVLWIPLQKGTQRCLGRRDVECVAVEKNWAHFFVNQPRGVGCGWSGPLKLRTQSPTYNSG